MPGIDQLISRLGDGGGPFAVIIVALLLGLRHASDPDHLVAVSTLVASERERPARRATALGLAWGLGHASTVVAFGLPVVYFDRALPDPVRRAAEVVIGLVIMALALRLLRRWRTGMFHVHEHAHGDVVHRHLHGHESSHEHVSHEHLLARSPTQAYAIGLVHGVGGSAAVGILLLASIDDRVERAAALVVFASGTAVSMAALSSAFGYALGRGAIRRRLGVLAPLFGSLSFGFGAWYALGALNPADISAGAALAGSGLGVRAGVAEIGARYLLGTERSNSHAYCRQMVRRLSSLTRKPFATL
jgi:ABC-type nickel/cobalt efflux system permease component RcnA